MLILYDDRFENGINRTPTSEVSALPATNAAILPVGLPWRSVGTSATIQFDMGGDFNFRVAAGIGTNLTTAATMQVKLSLLSAGATDVYDSGSVSANVTDDLSNAFHVPSTGQTCRYVEITFTDTSLDFIDIGRLVAGPAYEPTGGPDFGRLVGVLDGSQTSQNLSGETVVSLRGRRRVAEFQISANTESEMMTNALPIDMNQGQSKPVLVLMDPETDVQRLSVYGHIDRSTMFDHWIFDLVRKRYRIIEYQRRISIEGGPNFVVPQASLTMTGYVPTVFPAHFGPSAASMALTSEPPTLEVTT